METLAPTCRVHSDEATREVHYSASGMWTQDTIVDLQKQLFKAAQPFIEAGQTFRVLGDLRDFPVQTREITAQMQQIQEASASFGVDRMALIITTVLVKQQFRRVSDAVNMQIFNTKSDAITWLRAA